MQSFRDVDNNNAMRLDFTDLNSKQKCICCTYIFF